MKKYITLMAALIFLFTLKADEESALEKYKRMQKEDIDQWQQERDAEMDAYKARVEKERKEWMEYVNNVRSKWGEFHQTTPKVWADYGNDLNSLSVVDFDKSNVQLAAVVESDNDKAARELISMQFDKMMNEREKGTGNSIMAEQIAMDYSKEQKNRIEQLQLEYEKQQKEIQRRLIEQQNRLQKRRMEAQKQKEAERKKRLEEIAKQEAEEKIEAERKKIELLKKKQEDERKIAENVKAVNKKNKDEFIKEALEKKVKKEIIIGEDGRARTKYSITLDMVPNSIQKRAEKYMELVMDYSKKNDIEPALVLALIHTESAFNPKAFSRRPDGTPMACGLMQIIPSQAGRDAHKALYGSDKIVESDFLFDPQNNLNMGTWYIKWLNKWWKRYEKRKYGKNSSDEKIEYYSISSYNQGMGTILNRAYKPHNLLEKSADETYAILTSERKIPKEGRDYLERVTTRKKLYKKN